MDDLDIMARTIFGEAGVNENGTGDEDSAVAIANVIMNRVRFPNWPDDIIGVCLQPKQFSCWNDNDPNRARIMAADYRSRWLTQCRKIAARVRAEPGGATDPTKRATHYHTFAVAPRWSKKKAACYNDGYHYFYNNIDTPPPTDAPAALEQERPIAKTRTVRGGKIAVAGIAGSGVLMELQNQIEPLIPYSEYLKYAFLAVALISIGVMVYARINDRREGLR